MTAIQGVNDAGWTEYRLVANTGPTVLPSWLGIGAAYCTLLQCAVNHMQVAKQLHFLVHRCLLRPTVR